MTAGAVRDKDSGMANGDPLGGDRLWTVAEVADHMRVSNMTVYRLIKAGQLPAIRVGKNYRIRGRDLVAYLDASATHFGESGESQS
jgi:excisionase family DNA binding protein